MAKITDQGYEVKPQNDWFAEEQARYLDIDPDWNLDPSTPDGIKTATDSEIWANLDELGQKSYNSKDPNKSSGNDLDVLASITGAKRGKGSFSNSTVTVIGTNGTIILSGALIELVDPGSDDGGSQWTVDSDTTISGATDTGITAVDRGDIQASIGTLTKIVNPQSGWQSVTNAAPATPGTNPDTDAELRLERTKSVALPGFNQVDSTFAAIAQIDGVRRVRIYENNSISPTDPNGLPIHSTAILVDGGVDEDIAQAIYNKRSPGPIQFELSDPISVNITSTVTGDEKTIKFNRPDQVDITIIYSITDDGTLPANIEQLIKDATLLYTNGELLDSSGFNQTGFNIGENVQDGRFYTPANFVLGQFGNSYVTGITVNGGSLVVISFEELSRFTDSNISVVI